MLFNTLSFAYLVIITFCLYYLPIFKRIQLLVLIGASFLFYAWNYPVLVTLLIVSIIINAAGSYGVAHCLTTKKQQLIATVSVFSNLLILSVFKYAGLIGTSFFTNQPNLVEALIAIPLPVGISFFTFQGIS